MKLGLVRRITRASVITSLLTTPGCVWWAAYELPPESKEAKEGDDAIASKTKAMRVVVTESSHKYRSDALRTCLGQTGLFEIVSEATEPSETVLAASVSVDRPPIEPLTFLTWLTLGIIPEWTEVTSGFVIRLSPVENPSEWVDVDCRYEGTVVVGWPSMLLTPLASFATAWKVPEETKEFAAFARRKILDRGDELLRILGIQGW